MLNNRPENDTEKKDTQKKITVSQARRMLGMISRNYSDEEIEEIIDHLYGIADVAYDKYSSELYKNDSKRS